VAASVVRGSVVAAAFRDRWDVLLVIATGGAMGSLARWGFGVLLPTGSHEMPWSTWAVNVVGAFLLGVLMVFVLDVAPPSRYLRPFVGVGVLGGFTTFSTYVLDTRTLLASGDVVAAGAYLIGTLLTGLVAVWVGVVLARAALSRPRGDEQRRTS
jgi:fluoride exporter